MNTYQVGDIIKCAGEALLVVNKDRDRYRVLNMMSGKLYPITDMILHMNNAEKVDKYVRST